MELANIIINIIISIFYVLLLNYYLDNKYEKKRINHTFKYIIQFILAYISMSIFRATIKNLFIVIILIFLICVLMYSFYNILIIEIVKDFCFIIIIQIITLLLSTFIFKCIFELAFKSQYILLNINYLLSKFFLYIIIAYISYIIISLHLKQKVSNFQINFKIFKLISFLISIFYVVFILIDVQEMFLFPRITKITIFTFIIYNTSLLLFNKYQIHHDKIENLLILERQRSEQEKKYIYEKMRADQEIQTFRHDLKNSYTILQAYITNNEYEKALDFINERTSKLMDAISINHLGMSSIDCIIEEKVKTMKEKI